MRYTIKPSVWPSSFRTGTRMAQSVDTFVNIPRSIRLLASLKCLQAKGVVPGVSAHCFRPLSLRRRRTLSEHFALAPELLRSDDAFSTTTSDLYSFASTTVSSSC